MKLKRIRTLTGLVAAGGVTALTLTACGGQAPNTGTPAGATGSGGAGLRVGIFVDNAFGDGDFFDQAAKAESQLRSEAQATVKTYEAQLQAQNFEPMLQDAADTNDLVYVLGFEAIDSMKKVAAANPKTQFVFIDGKAGGPDVVSAVFRTQEGCFMAGALAGTVNAAKDSKVAGFVGGVNAPVVKNCQSGYEQGVAKVAPDQTVAAQYVGSVVDPAKGRETVIALAGKGAHAVFAYAGLSGAGAFDAAKSGVNVAPIGVVADKSALAPGKTPGSLIMGVDSVILQLTKNFQAGTLKRGSVHDYGFAEGGWKMTYDDKLLTPEARDSLNSLEQQLVDGKLQVK